MAERHFVLKTYLTKNEYDEAIRKAQIAGLSYAALIRKAVRNAVIREAPAVDAAAVIQKLRRVEKYLEEEVKHVENDTSFPVPPSLTEAYETTRDVEKMIAGIYG